MGDGKKILVVDDEPHVIKSLTFVLAREGYDVSSAENGEDAMTKIRQSRPSLVFLDVMMAHPTEGVDVSEAMMEDPDLRDIRVVMITAITDTQYVGDFPTDRYLHVDQFLTKPVPLSELLELTNRILKKK